jgi:pimeloyl-ACP methyl ester carboxylesterase
MFICFGGLGKVDLETETFIKKVEQAQYSVDFVIPPEEMKFEERPTVVLIHGWKGLFHSEKAPEASSHSFDNIRKAFLKQHDVNAVGVKWKRGQFATYGTDVHFLPHIGKKVAAYLDEKLGTNPVLWRNLTIVGHSLGIYSQFNFNINFQFSVFRSAFVR